MVQAPKNPHLPVPGLDIAFVTSPSFALVSRCNYLGKEGVQKKLEKTPQEMQELALVTKKIMLFF